MTLALGFYSKRLLLPHFFHLFPDSLHSFIFNFPATCVWANFHVDNSSMYKSSLYNVYIRHLKLVYVAIYLKTSAITLASPLLSESSGIRYGNVSCFIHPSICFFSILAFLSRGQPEYIHPNWSREKKKSQTNSYLLQMRLSLPHLFQTEPEQLSCSH